MMGQLVRLATDSDGVATLTLDDEAGRNAMSEAMVRKLMEALQSVATAPGIKVLILKGLPDVFSSGASREMLNDLVDGRTAPADILLPRAMLDIPVPTIAAIEGHAIGGGFALGLCADMVLISRTSRYGCGFVNLGFTPGMGTTRLIEHVCTPAIAHEMLYTGRAFKGAHFEGRSGFNYILPKEHVLQKANELAGRIAEKPRITLETLKRVLSLPRRQIFESTRTTEALMHQISFGQPTITSLIDDHFKLHTSESRQTEPS